MCGRVFIPEDSDVRMLRAIFGEFAYRSVLAKTGEVSPGDIAPVIASNRKMDPQTFAMHWGYRLPDGKLLFNARSETAAEKPMFADGIARRRCLIPAACYYEWERKSASEKVKYAIAPEGNPEFCIAGIYRLEQSKPAFTVLTREPAPEIAFIHNRMPVILESAAWADWINPRYHGRDILRTLDANMIYRAC